MRYIIAIDQSTSATKAILFDERAQIKYRFNCEHKQIYPRQGWVEHDPDEIYQNVVRSIKAVIKGSGVRKESVKALAITNQRETTVLWGNDGKPVYNAIVWHCSRAMETIKSKTIQDQSKYIESATGIKISPYFPSAKAKWICENVQVESGAYFGTIDTWLVWNLTGNHYTDYSNASRTQLFNLNTCQWDEKIIRSYGLQSIRFPDVKYADDIFGYTTLDGFFEEEIPVTGVMGDSHAALFGQKCFSVGSGKATFGTGTSVMVNIGEKPIASSHGLVTSIAWGIQNQIEYVYEGNINSSGDTIKWLVDSLNMIDNSIQSEEYANSVDSTNGVYLVPAFHGLGAPHWDYECRGLICGLRRDTKQAHIVRAGLESIAYQICDIIRAMQLDLGESVKVLYVDGGATNNKFLMQFVSDILRTDLIKAEIEELSARGVAFAAGLAVGFWKTKQNIVDLISEGEVFNPNMQAAKAEKYYSGWINALKRTMVRF